MRLTVTVTAPSGAVRSVNFPFAAVVAPFVVPRTSTRTPSMGCPDCASVTVPVTVRVCAKAGRDHSSNAAVHRHFFLIHPPVVDEGMSFAHSYERFFPLSMLRGGDNGILTW